MNMRITVMLVVPQCQNHMQFFYMKPKILEDKISANQSVICLSFIPPTFLTLQYSHCAEMVIVKIIIYHNHIYIYISDTMCTTM